MVQLADKMQSSRGGAPKKKSKGEAGSGAGATAKGGRKRAVSRPKHELSSGLPANWPNSSPEELALRPVRHIEVGNPQTFAYSNNFIKSSHYQLWNFLPKFLLEEFDPRVKIANAYFIGIALLQMVPSISVTQGVPTTLIPLSMLVFIDGLFVFLEDLERHRSDAKANATIISRYNPDKVQFEEKRWADLEVGDFVQIGTRQIVPADIILISVAEKGDIPTGKCFVETKSLDGETNLKARQALQSTYHDVATVRALDRVRGTLSMEHPNRSIHSFQGVIELDSFQEGGGGARSTCEVNKDNVVLRGSVVRNCHWVIGLVVNTGKDTKIFMSTQNKIVLKHSNLEKKMQREILKVFGLLIGLCVLGAFLNWFWEDDNQAKNIWYLNYPSPRVDSALLSFLHFILVHAPMIPVSLYVSIAVTRYAQSYFMHHDLEMYHEVDDRRMEVKNMNLNEQLGQISHLMTDKTGTLTCNVMDFRKMSVYGVRYGKGISSIARANWEILGREIPKDILDGEEKAQENAVKHVAFYCPRYEADMATHSPQRVRIQGFFRALAICHDAEIEHDPLTPDEPARLSTANPDDEALICAADYFGFKFVERTENSFLKIENRYSRMTNNVEEVECLHIFDWNAKRKRMSALVKDPVTGVITLYCKGADSVIIPLLAETKGDEAAVVRMIGLDQEKFLEEGLRCLYVASRIIKDDFYKVWSKKYNSARVDLRQLERKKKGEPNVIDELIEDLEQQLTLLGCTGIEDRLQYGVSESIEELMAAGINIWMLTGDGQDTAVNSGLAAKIILPSQHSVHCVFDRKAFKTKLEMRNAFKKHINTFDSFLEDDGLNMMKPWFLVIDGATLAIAMEDQAPDGMRYLLTELCLRCRSVIGCRVSPSQKKELVNFVVEQPGTVVVAVGDGANDMPMIRAAHVGVGLIGQEGEQAAAAADYSISQFRYLSPLIIKHGQNNYMRMGNLICYVFYKNLLMSLAMYWFNLNSAFTGQAVFSDGAIQMYNLFYTSLPIVLYAAHDMAFSSNTFYRFPQTYRACIAGKYFNTRIFWNWMGTAIYESLILAVVPMYILQGFDSIDGNLSCFWQAGVLSMSAIVICVNTKMLFIQNKFHWTHFALLFGGILSWFISIFIISDTISIDFNMYKIFMSLILAPYFWFGLILLLTLTVGRDIYSCAVERHFNFEAFHIVQEADAKHMIRMKKKGHELGGDPDLNRVGLRKQSVFAPKIAPGAQKVGIEMAEKSERDEQDNDEEAQKETYKSVPSKFQTPSQGFTTPRVIKEDEATPMLSVTSTPAEDEVRSPTSV